MKRPLPRIPAEWLEEIRLAIGDARSATPFGKLLGTSITDRMADLARAKFDFDVVGHYARPDVFQLTVNEEPMKSVTFQ